VLVLALAFAGLGASLGAGGVAVAGTAARAGHQGTAGLLLAAWGLGSMLGGAAIAKRPPRGDARTRLVWLAAASALLHALVAVAVPAGLVAVGGALLVAGLTVAQGFATAYGITARIAPEGTSTEAFSWLSTGIAVGVAAGSAVAGALTDGPGPRLAYVAGALAPLAAAALIWMRRGDLLPSR
jgi:MFS family permease